MLLILMQGVPGSGKSTLARKFAPIYGAKICSTDDFHHLESGEHVFDPLNIGYYHAWNQYEAEHWMQQGLTVFIDNTNILRAHAQPYLDLARRYGYETRIWRCGGNFQSEHGVPLDVIETMKQRMERIDT